MKAEHQLDLPRRLQIEFSAVVQRHTDDEGGEVNPTQMWNHFAEEYLAPGRVVLREYTTGQCDDGVSLTAQLTVDGRPVTVSGTGSGPIDALVHALSTVDIEVRVLDYAEHALTAGESARAAAYVECAVNGETRWGVAIDANIVTASLRAVVGAVNRA